MLVAAGPALFSLVLDGRPVRFGAPLPAAVVASGLRLQGAGSLQWRLLAGRGPEVDPVWVEIAVTGPPGTVRIFAGGAGPSADGRGPCYVREEAERVLPCGRERTVRWRWVDGGVDERVRLTFTAETAVDGEVFAIGEHRTVVSAGLWTRADAVCRLGRGWAGAIGLLPPVGGGGLAAKELRAHVAEVLPRLRELPGARGAGDYGRSGNVVCNLEFDTPLAWLRCAVGLPDAAMFVRACRSAQHLVDRDLDLRTGLPFPHGLEHRTGVPEVGHCWLQGLLWVGLLTADDDLLLAAHALGAALAAHPPRGVRQQERLRDYAWPLLELEALLAVADDRDLAHAADVYAQSIARRYDGIAHTFRFGEGEVGNGVYLERGWLVGGLLLPALRAHLQRRPNARLAEQVAAVEQALLERIGKNGQGLPTHWRVVGGEVFAEHREEGTAEAAFLLDGLAPLELARLLKRSTVRAAVREVPSPDDPDLATQLTMLARCNWLWR